MSDLSRKLLSPARAASRAACFALREPGAALTALRMASWVAALSLIVRLIPLPRAMKLVATRRRVAAMPDNAAREQARLARILDSVLAADFWFLTPTCWKRAPVLHRFLALKGIETRIVFGVRREGEGVLNGHAWLEAGGEPLLEKSIPDYKVTYSFP
ncbi:MAG: lasso peptide biosynthesis B2 protein [Rubrivivax sp.]|nr:lasso peptide biosynthesis B2 protein [Pyrinomonadaceae bacterium]